jgi:hypothetical protein
MLVVVVTMLTSVIGCDGRNGPQQGTNPCSPHTLSCTPDGVVIWYIVVFRITTTTIITTNMMIVTVGGRNDNVQDDNMTTLSEACHQQTCVVASLAH